MTAAEPETTLSAFSSPGAVALTWRAARTALEQAQLYWLTTVRPDGRPHVTPLIGLWSDATFSFCTGDDERKAKNLAGNAFCAVTTGVNVLDGLDLVVEGSAAQVKDGLELAEAAGGFETKYGARFTEPGGTWFGLGDALRAGTVPVFRVTPTTVFGFGKGDVYSQTRFRFD